MGFLEGAIEDDLSLLLQKLTGLEIAADTQKESHKSLVEKVGQIGATLEEHAELLREQAERLQGYGHPLQAPHGQEASS